jgi:hypothetical protein
MYIGSGATLKARTEEAISATSLDVETISVSTPGVVSVKTSLLVNAVFQDIVDDSAGMVDEICIENSDDITHNVTVEYAGANTRQLITAELKPGVSLFYKPRTGWQVLGTHIGSGWVSSGMLGNGSVVSGAIGSGQVDGYQISSGTVMSGDIANAAVFSGSISSGNISNNHFSSGAKIDSAEWLESDNLLTAEMISGGKAVTLNSSGALVIAMAGKSGRFPAIGVVGENYVSGAAARRFHKGKFFSTVDSYSGSIGVGEPIWLGISGNATDGNVLPLGSGLAQILGYGVSVSGMTFEPSNQTSGLIGRYVVAQGEVFSGAIASGSIHLFGLAAAALTPANVDMINNDAFSTLKFASGISAAFTSECVDGMVTAGAGETFFSEEAISGVKAVNISQSGYLRIAMAGVSGRMPAVGIVDWDMVSGQSTSGQYVTWGGPIRVTSGLIPTSGLGLPLYVGMSGEISTKDGISSGMVVQQVGINKDVETVLVSVEPFVSSGLELTFLGV